MKIDEAMDRRLENIFFEAFEPLGLFDDCVSWMAWQHDLGYKWSKDAKPERKLDAEKQSLLMKQIAMRFEAYDEKMSESKVILPTICITPKSGLMVEIASNIDECSDEKQKERYIYSLLKPFKRYSDIFHPIAVIEAHVKEIERCKAEIQMWEQATPMDGSTDPQKQVEACKGFIERYQYQMERAKYVSNKYREILHKCWVDRVEGTPEYYLDLLRSRIPNYTIALDVVLLERGFNLLYYQQQAGIYLMEYRKVSDIDYWLGGRQLAQKYIDEANPKHVGASNQPEGTDAPANEENTLKTQKKELPPELDTPEAKAYFEKAIELKAIDENYNWLLGKELCSCFSREMSHKLGLSNKETAEKKVYVNWKPFQTLFGYKNLRGNLNDIEKRGYDPKGIETINEIFGL